MQKWPLVGRAEELDYIVEIIGDPARRGVFLAGAAGIGKTRLLSEVSAVLDSYHVERATATISARQLPFGALAHLMPERMVNDRADLLLLTGAALQQRAEGRPAVLVVDDAHLLDPMSAAFVHFVATSGLARILISVRSGEVAPDAITGLYRDEVLLRLELQPLARAEFDELIAAVLGGSIEPSSLERLWTAAAGNILFVRELLLDATEAGTLHQDGNLWHWTGRVGTAVRLREIVFSRIGQLSPSQRRLLDLLAIAEPFSATVAERLAPAASIVDAERRGLVTVETNGRRVEIRLGHPLFGEALHAALTTTERRAMHRALADALETTGSRRRDDVLRVCLWRMEAGDHVNGRLLAEAAQIANSRSDFELAERLAREATRDGDNFNASLELGRALCATGRHLEAEATLRPLASLLKLTDEKLALLADARVLAVGHGIGHIDEASEILIEAEERVVQPETRALLQTHRAALLAFAARFGEAAEVGEAALTGVHDDATRVRAISSVGSSLVMAGKIDRALELNDELLPIALGLQDRLPRAPGWVLTNRVTALVLSGRFDDAIELLDFFVASGPKLDTFSRALVGIYRGRIALGQGKPATARRLIADAVTGPGEARIGALAPWCRALQFEACALLGDFSEWAIVTSGTSDSQDSGHLAYDADRRRAQAWVSASAGQTTVAVAQLTEAADLARSRGQGIFELLALHDGLRLGEHESAPRAHELAATIDGPWAAAIRLHAAAVVKDDPTHFDIAASAFEAFGSHLVAAELLALASTKYNERGMRAKASAATRRGHALRETCEGARTPQLAWSVALVPLSRREREVAALAAQNRSNAEISSDLHISIRTVESHLYSAYAKLGVTQRSQLAPIFDVDCATEESGRTIDPS
jgi:DNA-binding CsgD family transcriptional regulator/tetratricopeptide (TPR) repeat protein